MQSLTFEKILTLEEIEAPQRSAERRSYERGEPFWRDRTYELHGIITRLLKLIPVESHDRALEIVSGHPTQTTAIVPPGHDPTYIEAQFRVYRSIRVRGQLLLQKLDGR